MKNKKLYLTPDFTLMTTESATMLATSDIDYGGGNTGGDKPHVAESNAYQWNDEDWNEE